MYLVGTKLGTRYSNSAALVTANTDVFTTDYAPTYDDSFLYVYVISNTCLIRENKGQQLPKQ